jgi:hypothetical protein
METFLIEIENQADAIFFSTFIKKLPYIKNVVIKSDNDENLKTELYNFTELEQFIKKSISETNSNKYLEIENEFTKYRKKIDTDYKFNRDEANER